MSESQPVQSETEPAPVPPVHTEHPAEVALFGFIAGVVDVMVVPGILVTTIQNFWKHAQFNILTVGLLTLVVPMALLVVRRTRKFAEAMILGGAVTAFALTAIVMVLKVLLDS